MYRNKEAAEVYHLVKGGDSVLIVGPSGMGKSVFAKKLLEKPALKKFLGGKVLSVYLSVEELPQLTPDNFFRLYLKKLVDAVNDRQLNFHVVSETEVYRQESELFLLERIRTLLKLLLDNSFRILIVVDGLERLADAFDQGFFANLKSLRDSAFPKFSYLLLSRSRLLEKETSFKVEPLLKFLTANIIYLKPLSRPDSKKRVAKMINEREVSLEETQIRKIIDVGGGYPSLLKLALQYLDKNRQASHEALIETVLKDPSARQRLDEIYGQLNPGERDGLKLLSRRQKPTPEVLKSLESKGLVLKGKIFTPLFEKYLNSIDGSGAAEPAGPDWTSRPVTSVFIDPLTRRAYREGKEIGNLTRQEFRLLDYLFKNPDKICDREEIIRAVWMGEAEEGISDEAIDQLITRLRSKIEKDKSNPEHLLTIRGRGFSFKA